MALVVVITKCFTVDAALVLALLPSKALGGAEITGCGLGEDEKRLEALSLKRFSERYEEDRVLSGGSSVEEGDGDMVTD